MQFLFLLSSVACASYGSQAATNQDMLRLKSSLKEFIATNGDGPIRNIPLLVRASFHDLAAYNGENGPEGCLLNQRIQAIAENAGLSPIVQQLSTFVAQKFPTTQFGFGDVISLAGKVAVETAYPCINIPWSFGRTTCQITGTPGQIPAGNMTRMSQMQPFLDRYGLSATEMAILLAGAHGINGAQASMANSGFGTQVFAGRTSGADWIDLTFKLPWLVTNSGFFANDPFPLSVPIMRLPVDMLFFPTVASKNDGMVEQASAPVERYLKTFTTQDRRAFDEEFARVYSKMLAIGTSENPQMTEFVEQVIVVSACPSS